jgi:hypothetical protein
MLGSGGRLNGYLFYLLNGGRTIPVRFQEKTCCMMIAEYFMGPCVHRALYSQMLLTRSGNSPDLGVQIIVALWRWGVSSLMSPSWVEAEPPSGLLYQLCPHLLFWSQDLLFQGLGEAEAHAGMCAIVTTCCCAPCPM